MVSKTEALTAREFHYGECRATVGTRGGVTIRQEVWRRNGQTQTWKTRPEEFRVPIKYGMRDYWDLTQDNASDFHDADKCVLLIVGKLDKAPTWLLDQRKAQVTQ